MRYIKIFILFLFISIFCIKSNSAYAADELQIVNLSHEKSKYENCFDFMDDYGLRYEGHEEYFDTHKDEYQFYYSKTDNRIYFGTGFYIKSSNLYFKSYGYFNLDTYEPIILDNYSDKKVCATDSSSSNINYYLMNYVGLLLYCPLDVVLTNYSSYEYKNINLYNTFNTKNDLSYPIITDCNIEYCTIGLNKDLTKFLVNFKDSRFNGNGVVKLYTSGGQLISYKNAENDGISYYVSFDISDLSSDLYYYAVVEFLYNDEIIKLSSAKIKTSGEYDYWHTPLDSFLKYDANSRTVSAHFYDLKLAGTKSSYLLAALCRNGKIVIYEDISLNKCISTYNTIRQSKELICDVEPYDTFYFYIYLPYEKQYIVSDVYTVKPKQHVADPDVEVPIIKEPVYNCNLRVTEKNGMIVIDAYSSCNYVHNPNTVVTLVDNNGYEVLKQSFTKGYKVYNFPAAPNMKYTAYLTFTFIADCNNAEITVNKSAGPIFVEAEATPAPERIYTLAEHVNYIWNRFFEIPINIDGFSFTFKQIFLFFSFGTVILYVIYRRFFR